VAAEVSDALDDAGIRARSLVVTPIALLDFLYFCPKDEADSIVALVEEGGTVELDHYVGATLIASHIVKPSEVSSAAAVGALVARETSVVAGEHGEPRVFAISRDVEPEPQGLLPPEALTTGRELLRKLEGALAMPEGFCDTAPLALVPAIGVALAAVREGKGAANLLPAEERRAVEEGAPVATFLLAALLVVVTLVWLVSAVVKDHRTRGALDAELARLEPEIRKVHENTRKADELREKLRALSHDDGLKNSLFLRELTETVPKEAYLTTFRVRNGRVELEGFAGSASELVPLLEKSPHFKEAQFTSPVTKVQANQERFSLTAEISP
jgi:Tfp pilus assembly protein PilN